MRPARKGCEPEGQAGVRGRTCARIPPCAPVEFVELQTRGAAPPKSNASGTRNSTSVRQHHDRTTKLVALWYCAPHAKLGNRRGAASGRGVFKRAGGADGRGDAGHNDTERCDTERCDTERCDAERDRQGGGADAPAHSQDGYSSLRR
ncbi:MAG: hypothetical protein RJA70_2550 [Pseudomonadota bacterium]|jgi:hypothetical protein